MLEDQSCAEIQQNPKSFRNRRPNLTYRRKIYNSVVNGRMIGNSNRSILGKRKLIDDNMPVEDDDVPVDDDIIPIDDDIVPADDNIVPVDHNDVTVPVDLDIVPVDDATANVPNPVVPS